MKWNDMKQANKCDEFDGEFGTNGWPRGRPAHGVVDNNIHVLIEQVKGSGVSKKKKIESYITTAAAIDFTGDLLRVLFIKSSCYVCSV